MLTDDYAYGLQLCFRTTNYAYGQPYAFGQNPYAPFLHSIDSIYV